MDESITKIKDMLKTLGFDEKNTEKITNELLISIFEKVYTKMLSPSDLNKLGKLIEDKDIEGIKSISNSLDPKIFIINFTESTQEVLQEFFNNIIDRCPPELLDELQEKLILINQANTPASTTSTEIELSDED